MKLRLQSNSIRLRLKRGEVDHLAKTGTLEEKIVMGNRPNDTFHYVLESSHAVSSLQAHLQNNSILVQIPVDTALHWATGNDVGIEASVPVGSDGKLQILIEKDFACIDGSDADNADTFPNPLAGMKC